MEGGISVHYPMNWHDKEDESEEKEENQFHISEPDDWEEPEVGVDLPPEPPEPPEIEHELSPEKAKEKSRQQINELLENQDSKPPNDRSQQPPPNEPATEPTEAPVTDPDSSATPSQHENDRGRDSLDELDRRINIAKNNESPQEEQRDQSTARSSSDNPDKELVDQILEIHTDIARADTHTEGLKPTLKKLEDMLRQRGIQPIEPDPGDKLDYHRHQVIETVDSQQPGGTIVELVRPGYENSEHVIEEALVRTAADN